MVLLQTKDRHNKVIIVYPVNNYLNCPFILCVQIENDISHNAMLTAVLCRQMCAKYIVPGSWMSTLGFPSGKVILYRGFLHHAQ